MKKKMAGISLLTMLLAGCGDDKTQNVQIGELQNKVLDLEEKLKSSEEEIQSLETRLERMSQQVGMLSRNAAREARSVTPPTTQTKSELPREKTLRQPKEEMRALARKRMQLKQGALVEERAKRTILGLLSQVSLDELVERMNKGRVFHPDGASWTRPRLEAFMQEHKLERRTQK